MIMKKIWWLLILCFLMTFNVLIYAQNDSISEEKVIIKSIEIIGNYEVEDEVILNAISSKVGDEISPDKLKADIEKIEELGYFTDVKTKLSEYEGGAKITFTVIENPTIEKIIFEGITVFKDISIIKEKMATKEGKILNETQLKNDLETIENYYFDHGYKAARVIDINVSPERNLHIKIAEGKIEDIEIVGTKKTKNYVILRELSLKKGDIFNANKNQEDLQNVFNLGFFEEINSELKGGSEIGSIILVINVKEAKTGQAGLGAGYSSDKGLVGTLSYAERNLFGKGKRISLDLEFGEEKNEYKLNYFSPWIDKKHTSFEIDLFNTLEDKYRTNQNEFREERRGGNFTFGRPIKKYTRLYAGFRLENISLRSLYGQKIETGDTRTFHLSAVEDTRDNIFNPSKGRRNSIITEFTGGLFGGSFDFNKYIFEIRKYYKVRKKDVFAFRLQGGATQGNAPVSEWFELGGVNNLRGYDEYEFWGTKMALLNVEYRFGLSGNLSGAAFFDAGQTWKNIDEFKDNLFRDVHTSIGAGLRFRIPVLGMGPVRLDFSYNLDNKETKAHFGIGHMF